MNKLQNQNSTGENNDSGKAPVEKATTDKKQQDRSKAEKGDKKGGAVLGEINDE